MNNILYFMLYPIYLIYLLVIGIRNFTYNKNFFNITKLNCKVISVGNISMGGTGKTPIVIELAKVLQKDNKVAILSRGYGRSSKGTQLVTDGKTNHVDWGLVGDEPALMAKKLSGIPIVVDENRVRGGQYLIEEFNPHVIILDDAFQHRKIHRDFDIVLIDSTKTTKFQYLREPITSLKRADLILITKIKTNRDISSFKNKISPFNVPVYNSSITNSKSFIGYNGLKTPVDSIKSKSVLTFSGIGNPKTFIQMVSELGFDVKDIINFKDHYRYSEIDINLIQTRHEKSRTEIILTTEKDILKLPPSSLPIYSVPINMTIAPAVIEHINKIFN